MAWQDQERSKTVREVEERSLIRRSRGKIDGRVVEDEKTRNIGQSNIVGKRSVEINKSPEEWMRRGRLRSKRGRRASRYCKI